MAITVSAFPRFTVGVSASAAGGGTRSWGNLGGAGGGGLSALDTVGIIANKLSAAADPYPILVTNFRLGLPDNANVSGLAVTINFNSNNLAGGAGNVRSEWIQFVSSNVSATNQDLIALLSGANWAGELLGTANSAAQTTAAASASVITIVRGSATDMWGLGSFSADRMNRDSFGLLIKFHWHGSAAPTSAFVAVDRVILQATYNYGIRVGSPEYGFEIKDSITQGETGWKTRTLSSWNNDSVSADGVGTDWKGAAANTSAAGDSLYSVVSAIACDNGLGLQGASLIYQGWNFAIPATAQFFCGVEIESVYQTYISAGNIVWARTPSYKPIFAAASAIELTARGSGISLTAFGSAGAVVGVTATAMYTIWASGGGVRNMTLADMSGGAGQGFSIKYFKGQIATLATAAVSGAGGQFLDRLRAKVKYASYNNAAVGITQTHIVGVQSSEYGYELRGDTATSAATSPWIYPVSAINVSANNVGEIATGQWLARTGATGAPNAARASALTILGTSWLVTLYQASDFNLSKTFVKVCGAETDLIGLQTIATAATMQFVSAGTIGNYPAGVEFLGTGKTIAVGTVCAHVTAGDVTDDWGALTNARVSAMPPLGIAFQIIAHNAAGSSNIDTVGFRIGYTYIPSPDISVSKNLIINSSEYGHEIRSVLADTVQTQSAEFDHEIQSVFIEQIVDSLTVYSSEYDHAIQSIALSQVNNVGVQSSEYAHEIRSVSPTRNIAVQSSEYDHEIRSSEVVHPITTTSEEFDHEIRSVALVIVDHALDVVNSEYGHQFRGGDAADTSAVVSQLFYAVSAFSVSAGSSTTSATGSWDNIVNVQGSSDSVYASAIGNAAGTSWIVTLFDWSTRDVFDHIVKVCAVEAHIRTGANYGSAVGQFVSAASISNYAAGIQFRGSPTIFASGGTVTVTAEDTSDVTAGNITAGSPPLGFAFRIGDFAGGKVDSVGLRITYTYLPQDDIGISKNIVVVSPEFDHEIRGGDSTVLAAIIDTRSSEYDHEIKSVSLEHNVVAQNSEFDHEIKSLTFSKNVVVQSSEYGDELSLAALISNVRITSAEFDHELQSLSLSRNIVVQTSEYGHEISNISITQAHSVGAQASEYDHEIRSVTNTPFYNVGVVSSEYGHESGSPSLIPTKSFSPFSLEFDHEISDIFLRKFGGRTPKDRTRTVRRIFEIK